MKLRDRFASLAQPDGGRRSVAVNVALEGVEPLRIVDRFADRVAQSERVEIEQQRATTEHVVPNAVGRNRSFLRDAQNNVVDFFAAGAVPSHWPHRMNFETVPALFRNLETKNFLSPRSQEQPGDLFEISQNFFADLRR